MKSAEYIKDLRTKSAEDLNKELTELRREQFNLRMQYATGQLQQNHRLGEVRTKIARVKTIMRQSAAKA